MAYLEDIRIPKCSRGCGRPAKKILKTQSNGHYGDYCSGCAGPMLKLVLEQEEQSNARARDRAANAKEHS